MRSRDRRCWRQVRNAEQTEHREGTQSSLPATPGTPGMLPGVSLLGAVAGTSWPMSPDQRSPTSPRPALSQEGAVCLVTGTGALTDRGGGCAGGLGGYGDRGSTSQTDAEDPPLRARPCLAGSRVGLSTFAEKNTGGCSSSSTEFVAVKWN